ncbi:MAG TPA: sigma-54 dependent transcriptional regulator [Gemmataceae bacterium]|nr:sigma-54 dependent transcriptional regulator [Gemmataceae bacterium]
MLRVFAQDQEPTETEVERFVLRDPSGGDARELIAASEALGSVIDKAKSVARSKLPVLIQGESGTGKELLARLIHEHSPRAKKKLVQINCAAFSENLIESEIFGHEKGAFTGADQRHLGYFERAHQGSLLLDEIGEMPLRMQAKLLRVLEEEAFERVGGEQMLHVDVHVIATTNRDLEQEIARGAFRNDLYYRLNALQLHVPPLRVRRQEIPALVQYFIRRFGKESIAEVTAIAPDALQLLLDYSWPGNIRQLRNVVHYACVLARGTRIEAGDLPMLRQPESEAIANTAGQTLAQIERQVILDTLRDVGGNRTAAALRLGITTRTLQNKLKRYREEAA